MLDGRAEDDGEGRSERRGEEQKEESRAKVDFHSRDSRRVLASSSSLSTSIPHETLPTRLADMPSNSDSEEEDFVRSSPPLP